MGQTKRLFEQECESQHDFTIYPDDMDYTYQEWVLQQEQEKLAYEEMLSDTQKFNTFA